MGVTKNYPVDKDRLRAFLKPFDNELKLEIEYYDEDRSAWFRQVVRSVRYVYPLGGEGTVVLSSKDPDRI